MIAQTALVLLAAGRASRFGSAKLAAMLGDRPLARHAADRFATLPLRAHIAVTGPHTPPLPGYARVALDPPDAPQSRSLALGIAAARDAGAQAVLIALADMPFVPLAHVEALFARFDGDRIASLGPQSPMPPALFGARHFAALAALTGDRGAGALLRDAPALALPHESALDIDTPADLVRAQQIAGTAVRHHKTAP